MAKIYISDGHGGKYSGAVGNGFVEKEVNTGMALLIQKELAEYECEVMVARGRDITKIIADRAREANEWGADLVVDLHFNAHGNSAARGFETFVHSNVAVKSKTEAIRAAIHSEVFSVLQSKTPDRGTKTADFQILRDTKMPAVLIEYLFLSNKDDANLINPNKVAMAKATADGIAKGLKLRKKPKPVEAGTFYRVVTGSFKNRKNAEDRVADLDKAGFDSFIDVFRK